MIPWANLLVLIVVVLAIGVAAIAWTALAAEKVARRKGGRSRCARCAYLVAGLPDPICPECGADLAVDAAVITGADPTIVRWRVGAAALVWTVAIAAAYAGSVWAIGSYFPPKSVYSGKLTVQPNAASSDVFVLTFDGVSADPASPAQNIAMTFYPSNQDGPSPNAPVLKIDPSAALSHEAIESWLKQNGYSGEDSSLSIDAAIAASSIEALATSTTNIAARGYSNTIAGTKVPGASTLFLLPISLLVALAIWLQGLRKLASGTGLAWLHRSRSAPSV